MAQHTSTRKRLNKTLEIAKDNKQPKNKKSNFYLKHAEIPKAKSERQELIIYMQKIESSQKAMKKNYYPKKYSKLMTYSILLLLFILTLSLKQFRLLALVYPVVMATGIYGELRNRLVMRRINVMKAKLKA
ncbi:MAG: hypothetical protein M3R72_06435 [Bacteroidota bacterium]|nr:hypothetical protein [Bacteroidota bacterium]